MVPANQVIVFVRMDGRVASAQFGYVTQDVQLMESALMELAYAQTVIIDCSKYSHSYRLVHIILNFSYN